MSMPAPRRITHQEYLAFEEQAATKHEYRNGQVYPLGDPYAPLDAAVVLGRRSHPLTAMAGATDNHITVVQNLIVCIRPHLRGSPCRLYSTDMRVETTSGDYLYPDLVVTCDEGDHAEPVIKRRPTLIVEVLSPSTEGYDRGEKFDDYAAASSLAEYVLVSTRDQRLEIWTYQEGHWLRAAYLLPAAIPLTSINLTLSFPTVYEGVQWGPRLLPDEAVGA